MVKETSGRERFAPYKEKTPEQIIKMHAVGCFRASQRILYTLLHGTPQLVVRYEDDKKVQELIDELHAPKVELDFAIESIRELEGTK